MKPTREKLKKALRQLRITVEKSDDDFVSRMAQAMEYAIRWATEETVGWQKPTKEAELLADCLKKDLRLK